MPGLTASLLATNNMFQRNLAMIRSHLRDCRLQTDRSLVAAAAAGGGPPRQYYSTFGDVQSFMAANRPKVRTKEEVLRENLAAQSH